MPKVMPLRPRSGSKRRKAMKVLVLFSLACAGLVLAISVIAFTVRILSSGRSIKSDVDAVMTVTYAAMTNLFEDNKRGIDPSTILTKVVPALQAIQSSQDLARCPADFREAFVRFVTSMELLETEAYSLPKSETAAVITGMLNGLDGEADGGYNRLTREWTNRVNAAHEAQGNLSAVAQRYTNIELDQIAARYRARRSTNQAEAEAAPAPSAQQPNLEAKLAEVERQKQEAEAKLVEVERQKQEAEAKLEAQSNATSTPETTPPSPIELPGEDLGNVDGLSLDFVKGIVRIHNNTGWVLKSVDFVIEARPSRDLIMKLNPFDQYHPEIETYTDYIKRVDQLYKQSQTDPSPHSLHCHSTLGDESSGAAFASGDFCFSSDDVKDWGYVKPEYLITWRIVSAFGLKPAQ